MASRCQGPPCFPNHRLLSNTRFTCRVVASRCQGPPCFPNHRLLSNTRFTCRVVASRCQGVFLIIAFIQYPFHMPCCGKLLSIRVFLFIFYPIPVSHAVLWQVVVKGLRVFLIILLSNTRFTCRVVASCCRASVFSNHPDTRFTCRVVASRCQGPRLSKDFLFDQRILRFTG